MAFGNIINYNPASHQYSEAGIVMAKLNDLFEQENGDIRLYLSNDHTNYIQYSAANSRIEFFLADTLEGFLDSTDFTAA